MEHKGVLSLNVTYANQIKSGYEHDSMLQLQRIGTDGNLVHEILQIL